MTNRPILVPADVYRGTVLALRQYAVVLDAAIRTADDRRGKDEIRAMRRTVNGLVSALKRCGQQEPTP